MLACLFVCLFKKKTKELVFEVLDINQVHVQWEKAYWLVEKLEHQFNLKEPSQDPKQEVQEKNEEAHNLYNKILEIPEEIHFCYCFIK